MGESNHYRDRYAGPAKREALIQQLLKEREDHIAKERELQKWQDESLGRETIKSDAHGSGREVPENASHVRGRQADSRRNQRKMGREPRTGAFTRKSIDQIKHEVSKQEAEVCTFKPKLNKSKVPARSRSLTRKQHIELLAAPRQKFWADQRVVRDSIEQSKAKECTFKPRINKFSGTKTSAKQEKSRPNWRNGSKLEQRSRIAVEDRLHDEARERRLAQERTQRIWQEEQERQHDFKPKVNPTSNEIVKSSDYRPIQERTEEIQREKADRRNRAKIDSLRQDPNLTFHPRLSKASRKIAQLAMYKEGLAHTDVVQRLEHETEMMLKRREKKVQSQLAQEAKECVFTPKLSTNSERIVKSNPSYSKDFLERQKEMASPNATKARRAAGSDGPKYTFKPSIGNAEEVLVHTRPQRLSETVEERFDRLSTKEKARTERLKAFISNQYYSQFDFQPKINEISRALGKSSGGFEKLYRNESGQRNREVKQFEAELSERKECTFQPRINRKSATVDIDAIETSYDFLDPRTVVERIEEDRKEKENWIRQQRREQEFSELQECTFSPEVTNPPPKSNEPVIVRGLGRYLELRAAAKKKQADLEQRQRKVFHQEPKSRGAAFTVPRPFQLSTSNRAARENHRRVEHTLETFKPDTGYSTRREQVSRILSM